MKKAEKAVKVADDEKDFAAVLNIITEHRSRALMSVNVESLLTYWEIGAFLSPRIHSGSWSTAVVGKLADYIKRNQPELRGYGKSNLYNMALVYDSFSSDAFLAVLDKYSAQLRNYNIFFQPAVGKSIPRPFRRRRWTSGAFCSLARRLRPSGARRRRRSASRRDMPVLSFVQRASHRNPARLPAGTGTARLDEDSAPLQMPRAMALPGVNMVECL